MAAVGDYNLFKRLIGDYDPELLTRDEQDSYLDDAARERSAQSDDFPLTSDFDMVPDVHKPEVIYQAAINWWWNKAAKLSDKHSTTVGSASQNVGEKFDRAMQMIEYLQTRLEVIATNAATNTVYFANNSRFSRSTLTRLGGKSEEDVMADD